MGYNRSMNRGFKIIPDLTIEEEITNILIGTLHLCAIVYHTGDSPDQGHYVCAVKNGDTWYTCNDDQINFGVKLECNRTVKDDLLIPYLLIYEKVHESEVSRQCEIRNAMSVDKTGLSTSQNDEGKDAPHHFEKLKVQVCQHSLHVLFHIALILLIHGLFHISASMVLKDHLSQLDCIQV